MDYYSDKLDKLRLQVAYENTAYQIYEPRIPINCSETNPELDKFMKLFGKKSWCFISAANPNSKIQSTRLNGWNNANLEFDLTTRGYTYVYSISVAIDSNWPPEESFVVFDMPLKEALILAKKYDQNAVLFGQLGACANLQWLDDAEYED